MLLLVVLAKFLAGNIPCLSNPDFLYGKESQGRILSMSRGF